MAAYLSPIGNEPQVDANGNPLSGGKVWTYSAGTSTAAATYTSSAGTTPQANPIILNSKGLPDNPIWIRGGTSLKIVITDSADVQQRTIDNVTGINDPAQTGTVDQWILYGAAPSYISATSFSLVGDQTAIFTPRRRIESANTAGTIFSTIMSSSYAAGVTTVTVTNDSGSLDSGMSAVYYGFLSATNPSSPYFAGQVLQEIRGTDGGSSTTNGSLASVTGTQQNITPKSTNSQIVVECTFQAQVTASGAGVNSVGGYKLYDNTNAADIGQEYLFGPSTAAGANMQLDGAQTVRAIVNNTTRTLRGYVLRAHRSQGTPTVAATSQVWTIREIQN